jgi:hypothetical protein
MAHYMLLIYGQPGRWESLSEDEQDAVYERYYALSNDLRAQDKLISANELQPTSSATTVRVRDGEAEITDGPFAETKEVLGGYYLIEADSLDEALEWAGRIPSVETGSVEVRPCVMRQAEVAQ